MNKSFPSSFCRDPTRHEIPSCRQALLGYIIGTFSVSHKIQTFLLYYSELLLQQLLTFCMSWTPLAVC